MALPKNTDWGAICKAFFPAGSTYEHAYGYQLDIIRAVFSGQKRITIRATTRAGKSYALAMVAILRAVLIDNHRCGIIAPTHDKTRIIMNYVADILASNPIFDDIVMLDTEGLTKLERLRKEVSKKRITFKNMSSIECKSVDLDSGGFGVLGWAYDTIIVDETDLIDQESYAKIYRMLVESPEACLVEIGNPYHLAHFYEHHHSDQWHKIHIRWQDCVAAGRMTLEAIEDQRRELTALEFQVLFDAEFPDEIEFAVFDKQAIENMSRTKAPPALFDKIVVGIDPAAGGRDLTVITPYGVMGNEYFQLPELVLDERDAMTIVGRAHEFFQAEFAKYHANKKLLIATDCVNNRGVHDRLKELGYDVLEFIAGKQAHAKKRFYNLKTEVAFKVAEVAKLGLIWNMPKASRYTLQFRSWTSEIRSDKQLKIIDPEEKSPDFADSAIIALFCDIYHEDVYAVGLEGIRPPMARSIERPHHRL